VNTAALPSGVAALKAGQRVECGVAEGRRGEQALSVRVLESLPSLAAAARFLSVMKFSAPRWSSLPQRPQLLHFSSTPFTSCSESLVAMMSTLVPFE